MSYKCKRCLTEIQANAEMCVWCYGESWCECHTCSGKGQIRNKRWKRKGDPWTVKCPDCNGTGWRCKWDGKPKEREAETGK